MNTILQRVLVILFHCETQVGTYKHTKGNNAHCNRDPNTQVHIPSEERRVNRSAPTFPVFAVFPKARHIPSYSKLSREKGLPVVSFQSELRKSTVHILGSGPVSGPVSGPALKHERAI